VSQGGSSRALTGLFALWGSRKGEEEAVRPTHAQPKATPASGASERAVSTKAFGKFLSALSHRDAPVLLDLGPVVGSNINYFGERLGCKFFVEDVYDNVEKFVKGNRGSELAEFFQTRFPQEDGSFDGILCWDILDYLDKKSAQVLARQMSRLLKPGGALLSFFQTVSQPGPEYTRYLVVDDQTLKHRHYPATRGKQTVFVNRDINLMFDGLTVADSFLLMTKTREIVFRKPEKKAEVAVEQPSATSVAGPSVNGSNGAGKSNGNGHSNGNGVNGNGGAPGTGVPPAPKFKPGGRIYTSPAAAKGTV
jgi:SAM-dependent methyltransferase